MGRTRGANIGSNKQPGLLSVRSALVKSGAQVKKGEERNEEGKHGARELN